MFGTVEVCMVWRTPDTGQPECLTTMTANGVNQNKQTTNDASQNLFVLAIAFDFYDTLLLFQYAIILQLAGTYFP